MFVTLLLAAVVGGQTDRSQSLSKDAPAHRVLPLHKMNFGAGFQPESGAGLAMRRMAAAVADDYFDGTSSIERVRSHLRVAQNVHARYLRCAFSWDAIEKSPGQYDWTFWDMLVKEAQRAGVELIPYVAYTPRWAAKAGDEFWSQPPRDPASYADFMYKIVERYRGRIHSWEIWNEPDNLDYWKGSAAGYAELVREAATKMRHADPAVVLVLGGMSHGPGPFFKTLLSDYNIAGYVDVIAMHAYPESWGEDRAESVFLDEAPQMAELVRKYGEGDGFWLNEMGYSDYRFRSNQASKWGIDIVYNYEHAAAYQAAALFKMETMALAVPAISLTAWYRIDDFSAAKTHFSGDEVNYHLGLLDADGKPKPAFYATKFFNTLFDEPVRLLAQEQKKPADSQAILDLFQKADGGDVAVGWLRSSRPEEVQEKDGLAEDHRAETVSLALPCRKPTGLHFYDEQGRTVEANATVQSGWLTGVQLRGDSVFVSTFTCSASW